MTHRIAVLPGDGVGPEVTREALRVLDAVSAATGVPFAYQEHPFGGAAVDAAGVPLPETTEKACLNADAVLLGAVGGPQWDSEPADRRPEAGLLRLRRSLGAYANLRPVRLSPGTPSPSPLRQDILDGGIDLLIVRELTGGLYYGDKGRNTGPDGDQAFDTMTYTTGEIERLARVGFTAARGRRRQLLSVDKSNVLATSRLWREVVARLADTFPDVAVEHMYVDNCAMQLVRTPGRFDVLITENTFGDILSDLGAALIGSIGLLPSASLGNGESPGLYEPVHGSAPDIAGQSQANPIGAIASAAMMLRYAFRLEAAAEAVEKAIDAVLAEGPWTADMAPVGENTARTQEIGAAVAKLIETFIQPQHQTGGLAHGS
ncbi:MAG: 3-isopropylmalate dehydrogenase [Thermaerobacterales bacterium]